MAAAAEVFERTTRRYSKPEWRINETVVGGVRVPVLYTAMGFRPVRSLP